MLSTTRNMLNKAVHSRRATIVNIQRDKLYAAAIARGFIKKETLKNQLKQDWFTTKATSMINGATIGIAVSALPLPVALPLVAVSVNNIVRCVSRLKKDYKFLDVYMNRLNSIRSKIRTK